ncbi:MAG: DUF192 domain-containing protein [Gammaproteobacteria bacterium]
MHTGSLLHAGGEHAAVATVYRTTNAWERLRGLLGRPPLGHDEGLLIEPCGSIHTFLMRYPIDVVYLNRRLHVLAVVEALPAWRVSMCFGAALTLELAAGAAARAGIAAGHELAWRPHATP